jgi:hypothetical protein
MKKLYLLLSFASMGEVTDRELSLRINPGTPAELWDAAEEFEHCGGGPFVQYDEYWLELRHSP